MAKRAAYGEDDGRTGLELLGLIDAQLDVVGVGRVSPHARCDEREVVLGRRRHRLDGSEAGQGYGQNTKQLGHYDGGGERERGAK